MIRVTIELLQDGNERRARTLSRLDVWNSGEGDATHSHCVAEIHEPDRTSRRVSVGLLNRRASSSWGLVSNALAALGFQVAERVYEASLAGIGERLRELLARELSWSDEEIERQIVGVLTGRKDEEKTE